MIKVFTSRGDRIAFLAGTLYEKLFEEVYGRMAGAGFPEVRPTHSPVFRHIRPEGSRASELAVRARMTKQSMAYLVDDLTRAGLLQSRPDPADRRARLVSLTPRGKEAEKTLARLSTQAEGELAKQIGEEELEALRSLLRRANAH